MSSSVRWGVAGKNLMMAPACGEEIHHQFTEIRVPRTTSFPVRIFGSTVMRSRNSAAQSRDQCPVNVPVGCDRIA